jgi:uracil-DNA glycosylase family protein
MSSDLHSALRQRQTIRRTSSRKLSGTSRKNSDDAREQNDTTPLAPVPEVLTLENLQHSAKGCKACDLWKVGTQVVFGEGPSRARVMFVGEQPGNIEDRTGHPFVGPAGKLLDEVLAEAGIDRSEVYVTNVVKHFKWEAAQRGKRRIHKKPRQSEIQACRPWLDAELKVVRPEVLVCLGASAAQALLGKEFRVTRDRGKLIPSELAPQVMATTHPASILRAPDRRERENQRNQFVSDLKKVSGLLIRKYPKAS